MRKNFLFLFLMTLLPLAGWAQGLDIKVFAGQEEVTMTDGTLPYNADGYTVAVTGTTSRWSTRRNQWVATADQNVTNSVSWQYRETENDPWEDFDDAEFVDPGFYKASHTYNSGGSQNRPSTTTQTGEFQILEDNTTTTGKPTLFINLAYIHKTYGDDDPVHPGEDNFEIVDESLLLDGDTKADVAQYLVVKRANGYDGEDVGDYHYYYDFSAEYYEDACPYKIIPLQTNSNLLIHPAPLTINVTDYWKKYKQDDPAFTAWTVVDETQLKNGDTADDIEITITREEGEAVNADLATVEGEEVAQLREGENGYAFIGVSKNYEITFENAFAIVPSDDYSGITVTVENNADETAPEYGTNSYIYKGTEYTPGLTDCEESDDLIVKDGDKVLVKGEDYEVLEDGYANNIHAGAENEAEVTIKLINSYVEHEMKGYFTIKKAPLTISAVSYQLGVGDEDPDVFEVAYNGFVNDETPETAKNFVEPSGVEKVAIAGSTGSKLVVNQDASADDYEITYADGAITFGETILIVTADNVTKIFGEEDPEFTATVTDVNGNPATAAQMATLTIGGQKAYTASREPGEDVGEYEITLDGPEVLLDGVVVIYNPGTLAITPKTVYLRGDVVEKYYGDPNPTFDASVWEGEGDDAVKWSDEKKAEEGVVNREFYYVGVENATYNPFTDQWILTTENVGEYTVQAHLFAGRSITASGNYRVVPADENGMFTIKPAPLTITADDKTVAYGAPAEVLTVTIEGLKFNETLMLERDYTISREEGDDAGEYAITVETVEESAVLANYDVTLVPGTYTITAAELVVTAKDQAIYYSQTINPHKVTITMNGEEVEWTEEQMDAVFTLSTDITAIGYHKDAYTLTPTEDSNYAITFKNGWLTIGALKMIPLDKDELAELTENSLKQVLEDHKGLEVAVKMPKRKMDADEWYTWVLPFEVKLGQIFSNECWGYGALEILDADQSKGDKVVFSLQMVPVPANTPFIVKIEESLTAAEMNDIIFYDVTIGDNINYLEEDPTTGEDGNVKFIGLYDEKVGVEANERFNAKAGGEAHRAFWAGGGVYAAGGSKELTLPRTNAYLQFATAEQSENARIFIQETDGSLTSITGVEKNVEINAEGVYNLNGMKIEGVPTQKGVYIQNGKKVVIK